MIGAAARAEGPEDAGAAVDAVRELVDAGASRRVAVDVVARLAGASRNELYRASLAPQD